MCWLTDTVFVPARDYLAEAKKRNSDLKKLRSVSRAYRKCAVRQIKMRATPMTATLAPVQPALPRDIWIDNWTEPSRSLERMIGPSPWRI